MNENKLENNDMRLLKEILLPNRIRRKSISMPSDLDNLDVVCLKNQTENLKNQLSVIEIDRIESNSLPFVIDRNMTESITNNNSLNKIDQAENVQCESDNDDLEFSTETKRDRFRTKRRASIAPLPALRLNSMEMLATDFDTYSVASNQASITSVNSVASLLREKVQTFPQLIRKKKLETKDYKIKIFVILMFFIIIFLICYAYLGYHQYIRSHSYFDKIKFNSQDRVFKILNQEQKVILAGKLGVIVGLDRKPFHCLNDNRKLDGSVCVEWNGIARLYMNLDDKNVFRCYNLHWQALSENVYPTDCFELKRNNGLWFGGGITKEAQWSLSETNFDYAPFATGDAKVYQFGNGIKRYFINSLGVAIQVDEKSPLYIQINSSSNDFCLGARNDEFTFVNHLTEFPELSYKICTTSDMKSLHKLMTQQSLWDGLKESDIKILHSLIEEPVWHIPYHDDINSFNEKTIYNYSEEIIDMGFMRLGHILVNEFWQENIGDFKIDRVRFPTFKDTIDVLHRRGFKIILTIQPFISTDSENFKEAVRKKMLIFERYSDRSIPALTRYKSAVSAGMLDVTNNISLPWLLENLQRLTDEYKVDNFYLDLGTSYNLPHYYQCRQTLINADMYAKLFTERLSSIGIMAVSSASLALKPPTFLSVPLMNSSWSGLRQLMMTILNYGVIGYPFVLPGAIGGDYVLSKTTNKMLSFYPINQPPLPDMELFIRWMQLVTFMPAMQFSHLPSEYMSNYVTDITKELIRIRNTIVVPLLKKILTESLNDGSSLIRPLWLLDPYDSACLNVKDEFSVGDELIVAPILEKSIEEREVYLPQGVWKDGIDGSLRKGSRWIHNYKVEKEKIAYFIKMPDNTRF